MPEEREQSLVHGDYHLGNALVGSDGTMRAVLDWELCTVGDPLADVGLMVAYWTEIGRGSAGEDALFPEPVTALPGFPSPGRAGRAYSAGLGPRSRRPRLLGRVRVLEGRDHRRGRLPALAQRPGERLGRGAAAARRRASRDARFACRCGRDELE